MAPYPVAPVSPQNATHAPKHFQNIQNKISQSKQLLSNIFKIEKPQKNSPTRHDTFSQSMGKIHSPDKNDISRRMSEPLNLRVTNSPKTPNRELILETKSSRTKLGNSNGLIDEKPKDDETTKMHESFQVYSIKPSNTTRLATPTLPISADTETNTSSLSNTEIPPLESIDVPPGNVSGLTISDTQIDTSVSSCVFVSDQSNTLDTSMTSEPEQKDIFRPLLLLIPLRLGQDKFNLEYARPLLSCLKLPQSVGIIGGRPKHALYIIGFQDEYIFYLDPHTTQQVVTAPHESLRIPDKTFHTNHVESMHYSELDPSLAIGFFCETEAVFEDLLERLETQILCLKPKLFEISDSIPFLFQRSKSSGASAKQEPFSLVEKGDILDDVIDLALDEDIDDWDIINFDQFP